MALRPRKGMFELPEDVVPTAVKPAPTTKQTAPVGIPSSDPVKTQPGETGPFDPNAEPPAPAPAPAPAPQQTGPIGIPSSDPTKRQPGETGPISFDGNAVEEVETAPTDTPTTTPVRQEEEAIYPYMYSTRDLGSGAQRESWQDQQVNFLTQSQLQIEFNQNSDLKRTFGDFNNYLSYMDGMLALAEEHPEIAWWDIGRLDSTTGETYDATSDPSSYYYGMEEEDMRSGSTALIDANQNRTNEIRAALEAMNTLPGYQQLLQDHNVDLIFQNNDGDVFQFNGLNSAEIYEVDDHLGIKEIASLGMSIALSVLGTPALANALTATLGTVGATAASSSIISAATQLMTTGEVDIKDALLSGATSVLTGAALDALEETGIFESLQEAVGGTTTDQLLDVDGNVIGEIVRDSSGQVISSTGVSANEWYTYATELGGVIKEGQTVAQQLSTVLDVVPDWLYDAGFETAEAINSAFEEAGTGTGTGAGDGEGVSTIPVVDGVRDIFTDEEETTEEDILADTTQEATGFEDSVVRELLDEYIQPVLASLEDQDLETAGIQTAIGTLTEQQQETLQEFVRQGGQIEELDSNQQQIIEDLGGVNEVVSDLAENVSGLEEGLQQAATEREDIRASQEAGFTQAEQDRQRLMEAIVEARGQTTELSQEMRDLLAQSNQTMQEMFEGTGVDIDELRSGQLSQEEATNALREYTQQEFGAVREELAAGLTEAQQERQELMEAWIAANGSIENLSEEMRDRFEATNQTVEELFAGTNVDIQELRDGQISQAQATDALREYTEQELGVVREELQTGLTEAQQERYELAQDLIEVGGLVENLDAASQERFDELDITVDTLAEEFGVDFDRLEQGLLSAEEATDALQTYAEEEFGAVREDIAGLEERIDANTAQQLEELTGLRSEFLATLSASEAAAIARNQGLSDQLTEQITGVRGETAAQIEGINERLTDRISTYEQQTGEQLDIAAEERAALGGQLGTLTSDVARVAEDVIRAGGRIEELDEASRQRYEELGLSIDELSLRVGVNLNALSEGMLTQDAALRELIEETTQQTEQSLTERLEEAEQGFATSLSDTEANLLSQITGVESGVLQQLAEVEGGLQSQFGEQFDVVQQQVSGLGEQVTGLGEGITGLGQALGVGLLGLAAAQPTAQEIASAMPRQPVEFDPFLQGLSPFQPLTPIALAPQKQTDALSELNKFIGRQTGMLV